MSKVPATRRRTISAPSCAECTEKLTDLLRGEGLDHAEARKGDGGRRRAEADTTQIDLVLRVFGARTSCLVLREPARPTRRALRPARLRACLAEAMAEADRDL